MKKLRDRKIALHVVSHKKATFWCFFRMVSKKSIFQTGAFFYHEAKHCLNDAQEPSTIVKRKFLVLRQVYAELCEFYDFCPCMDFMCLWEENGSFYVRGALLTQAELCVARTFFRSILRAQSNEKKFSKKNHFSKKSDMVKIVPWRVAQTPITAGFGRVSS